MTVIYFLYLFAFIEMLPPRDLGLVMLKWQEMEPGGPLAHHHPPPAYPAPMKERHPSLMGLGICSAGNHFPSYPISGHKRFSISFPGTPLGKDFLAHSGADPACTQLWAAMGESGTKSCQGEATGTLLAQGYGGISRSSCQQRT